MKILVTNDDSISASQLIPLILRTPKDQASQYKFMMIFSIDCVLLSSWGCEFCSN